MPIAIALRDQVGLDHDQAVAAAEVVLRQLLASGYIVDRPARISAGDVDAVLPVARAAWEGCEGDVDAGLRAVIGALVPIVAYHIGRREGWQSGRRRQ